MNPHPVKRHVHVGHRLNNHADIVPDPNELRIEYSVDPWMEPPDGYICFVAGDNEYFIPLGDITEPLAKWDDETSL
jgi:hypothetical protein